MAVIARRSRQQPQHQQDSTSPHNVSISSNSSSNAGNNPIATEDEAHAVVCNDSDEERNMSSKNSTSTITSTSSLSRVKHKHHLKKGRRSHTCSRFFLFCIAVSLLTCWSCQNSLWGLLFMTLFYYYASSIDPKWDGRMPEQPDASDNLQEPQIVRKKDYTAPIVTLTDTKSFFKKNAATGTATGPSFMEFTYPSISNYTAAGYSFPPTCPQQVHTYVFRNAKVAWPSAVKSYSYLQRGMSIHCLLARAADRNPTLTGKIRIGMADVDLNSTLSFQPAADQRTMQWPDDNQVKTTPAISTHTSQPPPPPLLFPDSTFESWAEVHDYSLPQSVQQVWQAALTYGLPGTPEWLFKRKRVLFWRGSPHGKDRKALIEMSSNQQNKQSVMLDIQAIGYNLTMDGIKLTSDNQVSRAEHCSHAFLLHMNGIFNNRYSSSLKWKLLCGSLVFVPISPLFVEWWNSHGQMQPYVHFVPFSSIPQLLSSLEYYSSNLEDAAKIARRGQQLAMRAMDGVNHYVDTILSKYLQETANMVQPTCWVDDKDDNEDNFQYKSLADLQEAYGPQVCARDTQNQQTSTHP